MSQTSELSAADAKAQFGCVWATTNTAVQHHIVYDFGIKVNLTEVNLLLPGADPADESVSFNPKCVGISYCLDPPQDGGVWLPSKRSFVPADEESLQVGGSWLGGMMCFGGASRRFCS